MAAADSLPLVQDTWLKRDQVPGNVRAALPYEFARSALFAAQPANLKVRRVFTSETEIASVQGFKIYQRTGKQLTQAEETLWLELLKLALKQPEKPDSSRIPVFFTANGMLKVLGKSQDSKNRAALRASLNLLGDARIRVQREDGADWTANLLDWGSKPKNSDVTMAVFIDRAIATCLSSGYTLANLEQRRALKDNPLAQWLHGFYSTHREPSPMHSGALQRLSSCDKMRPKVWAEKLSSGLAELAVVTGWRCEHDAKTGVVKVDRKLVATKAVAVTFADADDI
ncbi:plasmid replication initiator TrfA [Paraburkholderia sp. EG287A]|uniref:plasmid replication initiator TrfA n=1 Tax=Paraburkholderia sp. EG287A TaxID=3237012 RepID=UPI0034D279D7